MWEVFPSLLGDSPIYPKGDFWLEGFTRFMENSLYVLKIFMALEIQGLSKKKKKKTSLPVWGCLWLNRPSSSSSGSSC